MVKAKRSDSFQPWPKKISREDLNAAINNVTSRDQRTAHELIKKAKAEKAKKAKQ